ncbi:MAG: Holliday junction branch migration protein RuvA [Fusobacteriia bacterium 4572_132]|nr:MAG: Holliday junction branch migration protein RuvA [Fusobacteriia bacterium 4572_132]
MFEYIEGKVVNKKVDSVVLGINGLGYKIYIPLSTYEKIKKDKEKLYIYNYVREDAFILYGFYTEKERDIFTVLLNANGVGAKLAIAVLSTYNIFDLKEIIVNEQIERLIKVPGIGNKKGQKLILDIKDKIKLEDIELEGLTIKEKGKSKIEEELIMALQSLGYKEKDLNRLIKKEDIKKYKSVEEGIKDILRKI